MIRSASLTVLLAALFLSATAQAQAQKPRRYPPLREYLMPREAELALARSAAPTNITDHATFKVLTDRGYETVHEGDNGFVCLVERGFAAPTFTPPPFRDFVYFSSLRAPICMNPVAVRYILPYQELRAKLGMAGKSPDEISAAVAAAYIRGELPKVEAVGIGYMFSADMNLGPGIGHFHPHVMVFAPYYDNAMLGANPFGQMLPFVSDDTGTPYAVVIIPVDPKLAVKASPEVGSAR